MPSPKSKSLLLACIALTSLMISAAGCASAPPFRPSQPIEDSASLEEGLLLCSEYRLPAPAPRPIAFRPFVDCVEEVAEMHPLRNHAFERFRQELVLRYDLLREEEWTPRLGQRMETAVRASLRALWNRGSPPASTFTPAERDLVILYLPWTAEALRASRWKVSPELAVDPRLELLKAELSSLVESDPPGAPELGDAAISAENGRTCRRIDQAKLRLGRLTALWNDGREVLLLAFGDASSERTEATLRRRYRQGLETATDEIRALKAEVDRARSTTGFLSSSCPKGDHARNH